MTLASIFSYINHIKTQLEPLYKNKVLAEQYAWWILQALTGKTRAQLITAGPLTHEQEKQLAHWLELLTIKRMPLAYVIGSVPFAGLTIAVEPPFLIPRLETEEWVLNLIEQLKTIDQPLRILDIGTGSGCIALALAHALPKSNVYGVDISSKALDLAQRNAQNNTITNVTFIHSDLFDKIDTTFDIIVSNPPYISDEQWLALDPSVKEWEDKGALVAPQEGLAIIERIINQAPSYLRYNATLVHNNINNLYLEIDATQTKKVIELLGKRAYTNTHVFKDMFGNDRVVSTHYVASP